MSIKSIHVVALTIALSFAYSTDVFASGASHFGEPPTIGSLLWPAINFSIFLFLVIHFYRKLAKPILRDYRIELEASVAKQQNEHNMLVTQQEQLKERLSQITQEKAELVSELEKDGRDLANMIVSTANQQAEKIIRSSKSRYNTEVQKVSSEAKRFLIDKVVSKVSSQISSSLTADDDAKYIHSSLDADLGKIFQK